VKNIGASIKQRLKNKSRELNIPFDQILQRYGIERFLLRLSESKYRDKFILKGGQMLLVWSNEQMRPTMDVDFMGITENSLKNLNNIMFDLCSRNHPDVDGISFNPDSVNAVRIKEDAEYEGVRITFEGMLDTAKIHMQIDTGFDDAVTLEPEIMRYPSILGQKEPELMVCHRETLIAEKFEAMVKLGAFNSRMKDFFDIWLLSTRFSFEEQAVGEAISATFEHRGTYLDELPSILDHDFEYIDDKQTQWRAFIKKNKLTYVPEQFSEITAYVADFIGTVLDGLRNTTSKNRFWSPPGPWKTS
jgi:predicted nucleotidyltransferase component of viral defense system